MKETKTLSMANGTRDLEVKNKDFKVVSGLEAYKVICESSIRTCLGELPYNPEAGIPHIETIFENQGLIDIWRASVLGRIQSFSFVKSISKFDVSFNSTTHTLSYDIVIVTDDGELEIK